LASPGKTGLFYFWSFHDAIRKGGSARYWRCRAWSCIVRGVRPDRTHGHDHTLTAPTQYTDGTTIASSAAISYRVYQGAKGSTSKALVGTITSTSTTINSGLQAGQEYCWQVTAVINGVESAQSNEGCKSFAFPTPNAVTITVQ
jgi:hypothetical protein